MLPDVERQLITAESSKIVYIAIYNVFTLTKAICMRHLCTFTEVSCIFYLAHSVFLLSEMTSCSTLAHIHVGRVIVICRC